jgi:hypothetical protein
MDEYCQHNIPYQTYKYAAQAKICLNLTALVQEDGVEADGRCQYLDNE